MTIVNGPDLLRQLADQIAIMRHKQYGAFKLRQHLLEHFLRGDVKVVGRLVEHQEICAMQAQNRQRQTRALAAAQAGHRLEQIIIGEQELRHVKAQIAFVHALALHIGVAQQLVLNRICGDELLVRLRKVADPQAAASFHDARQRFELHFRMQADLDALVMQRVASQCGLEKSGFATAVWADQRRALTPAQF